MAVNTPYQTYKQNSVNTVSSGELTLMLYNGCLKFMNLGIQAIMDENIEEKSINLIKAQNIITELMVTLNMDYEISNNLLHIYDYLNRQLIEANIKNDIEKVNEVKEFVTQFRDSWKEAILNNRQSQYGKAK